MIIKKINLILLLIMTITGVFYAQNSIKTHGLSIYGDLKYGPDFKNFDYVNPGAPKGGKVVYGAVGTFDSMNPFIPKGNSAAGLSLIYDTLTVQSYDEPFSEYGLIAESIELPSDKTWIIFNLRKEAKWSDGTAVTADDVLFSFDTLIQKGDPFYGEYYKDVIKVEKLAANRVKFLFKNGNNRELPLIIGQMYIFQKKYYTDHDFTKVSLDIPTGNGPYKIVSVDPGRSITYKLDPNYWGKNLPVRKGMNNIETIKYIYYKDTTVILEAFKAGEVDIRAENSAKNWATAYTGKAVDAKMIAKIELLDENPAGMQAMIFNTRRDIFKDKLVREALNYAFDYEWSNKNLFFGSYLRTNSFFANSEMASSGLPSNEELALLNPLKGKIPDEVFTQEYKNPVTDGSGNNRSNLKIATELLQKAGWEIKNGILINKKTGKPFEFEYITMDSNTERIMLPYKANLEKLGIKMNFRYIDSSQYVNRVTSFDYDMIGGGWGQSMSPGNEQREFWGSAAADAKGSRNYAGIKDPAIDALVEKLINVKDRKSLVTACKALDRILLWGYYVIPEWYYNKDRVAYWDMFGRPSVKPKYSPGLDTWWIIPEKQKKVDEYRKNLK